MKYDLIDNDFQQKNASAYQLSILVGMDSLVYSVFDTDSQQTLLLKTADLPDSEHGNGLMGVLKKENLLDLLYRRVKIGVVSAEAALVPSRLYNAAERASYLNGLTSEKHSEKVQDDDVECLGLKVVYPAKSQQEIVLSRKFPTAKIYNGMTAYLHGCHAMRAGGQDQQVFAHFFDSVFYLAIFEKDRLIFSNSFNYTATSDVVYFTLLAYEQYGLSPESVKLHLTGNIVKDSDIYKMLYRYINLVEFMPSPGFLKFGRKFSAVPPHFFFPLHALSLCK